MNAPPKPTFEQAVPVEKQWFSPRWLARHWSCSINHVLNLIDTGEISDCVDMRGKGARRSMMNIPRTAVLDFLARRSGQASVKTTNKKGNRT